LTLNIKYLDRGECWCSLPFTWLQFIDENAEELDSGSDDDDSTSEPESEGGEDVSVKINSLKIVDQVLISIPNIFLSQALPLPSYPAVSFFSIYQLLKYILVDIVQESAGVPDLIGMGSNKPETVSEEVSITCPPDWLDILFNGYCLHCCITLQHATSTSPSGENKSTNPTADSTEDTKGSESGGDDDDNSSEDTEDEDSDTEDEDDALLTKQLNKQRKRAMAAALGRRRPLNSRNAYKDKGKGTMNSKIQRQACQWWMVGRSALFLAGDLKKVWCGLEAAERTR
jgi:hypothetical protein